MSIPTSMLILVILALRLILAKAPKRWRLVLWGMAALRLMVPVSVASPLSVVPSVESLPSPRIAVTQAAVPALTEPTAALPAAASNSTQAPAAFSWPDAVAWVWLAGAACMIGYLLIQSLRQRRRLATAVRVSGNVYQTDAAASPFVFGLIRPKIYLPFRTRRQDLPYVLLHEQAHIRHGDVWFKLLGFLLLAVYWFNPCIWAAYLFFSQDLELACDERVIRRMHSAARADYAESLLVCSNSHRLAAGPLAFDGGQLKGRIRAVLGFKKPTVWILIAALLAGIAVGVCFLTCRSNGNVPAPFKASAEATLWVDLRAQGAENIDIQELQLDAYPGVTFRWNGGSVEAEQDGETRQLFVGMPVWNVYLCDLTGDGKPEFCSTVSFGSGWIDERVIIYDYAAMQSWEIEMRPSYDYQLSLSGTNLILSRRVIMSPESPVLETKSLSDSAWLTQEDVIRLASKGSDLALDDFAMYPFQYGPTSGVVSRSYPVEGGYSLLLITTSDDKGVTDLILSDEDSYLTLRPGNVSERRIRAFFK
ncbi:MAG: M56 family metallopeptidase [Clostridiales bacterium]|nr:M56 family metallopeptidase [Clostridiales bacterium]